VRRSVVVSKVEERITSSVGPCLKVELFMTRLMNSYRVLLEETDDGKGVNNGVLLPFFD
jgi:hypothetical protein